jgi:uncharacterized protein with GYD domain
MPAARIMGTYIARAQEGTEMPSYLFQVAYTPEAWAAMVKKPQDRIEAVRPSVEKMGGKLTAGYLAFGEYDIVAIIDMPNNATAAAFAMAVAAGGACKSVKTTPLMSTREGIDAMKKASGSTYRPATKAAAKRR